jgi:hypothetical protein
LPVRGQACNAGEMGAEEKGQTATSGIAKCYDCGRSPAFIRPTGRPPASPLVCRDCLVSLAEHLNDNTVESTGISIGESPQSLDVAVLWEHYDTARHRHSLIHGFDIFVERGDDTISSSWKCDSASRPSARLDLEVALVKAFLERCGYHQVVVTKGIDTDLAARARLGAFYEKPDPDNPRWTVRIQFDRDGGPIRMPL